MLTIKYTTEVSLNAKDFFDFLKRNNAFEAYKSNFVNFYRKYSKNPDLVTMLDSNFNDSNNVKTWICHGFYWGSTPEGRKYWNNLDIEWLKYFKDCDKINLTPISVEDLKNIFRDSITGKWYKVTDNSYNRSADNDPNRVWDISSYSSHKDLIGKEYLILEEPCCVIMDLPHVQTFKAEMVKVWVPKYNCAQWVLFNPKNVCDIK